MPASCSIYMAMLKKPRKSCRGCWSVTLAASVLCTTTGASSRVCMATSQALSACIGARCWLTHITSLRSRASAASWNNYMATPTVRRSSTSARCARTRVTEMRSFDMPTLFTPDEVVLMKLRHFTAVSCKWNPWIGKRCIGAGGSCSNIRGMTGRARI